VRDRRLCGLKFRRQFPIDPFVVDFACVEKRLVVEIDGGYHESTHDDDVSRQRKIEQMGWKLMRFSNEDVLADVEAVAIAIARSLGTTMEYGRGKKNLRREKGQ
jgi:adenine-specific DNA-methyltransferase